MATVFAYGQGQVAINTAAGNAYVKYTNTVAGGYASGNSFYAGLYWATDAATLAAGGGTLVANGGTNGTGLAIFGSGGAAGYVAATTFGGNRTILPQAGVLTFFQLRAWSSTFSSYAAALTGDSTTLISKLTGPGASPIVSATPTAANGVPVPQILWAPGSSASAPFVAELVPVPEPSTIALVGLGLAGLYFIRRRK